MSENVTLVVCRPRIDQNSSEQAEAAISQELFDLLGQLPLGQLLATGPLYDLDPEGEMVERLKEVDGPIVFLTDMVDRAAIWTARRLGVTAEIVKAIEVADYSDPPAVVESVRAVLDDKSDTPECQVSTIDEKSSNRWFPVVDYDRCTGCLECLNFCLFGVYEALDGKQPTVSRPTMCRPGCPACSRVCPAGAIIFPYYNDPVISGRSER
jgi:NAD-dependent dihydropyrimidine dehydrogenase PreA subunit